MKHVEKVCIELNQTTVNWAQLSNEYRANESGDFGDSGESGDPGESGHPIGSGTAPTLVPIWRLWSPWGPK